MILGISMIAVSEAFNLGVALGISHQELYDATSTSSGQCYALTTHLCPLRRIADAVPTKLGSSIFSGRAETPIRTERAKRRAGPKPGQSTRQETARGNVAE
ncbi:hypothetical protein FBQ73_09100 [Xanthobacter autotrophicus]|uniref:3-hydroxyisobutyrate dehydrogenase-like NAD-binding domain-containing protein n=1 Tax=Xanthobacter autotrophicus TaxID=280 RepID=A0A6C1KEX7_XANAU|nr:hypothetical protein FBQ73_09100 [Xanthobacter autotrophicus]